MKGAVSLRTGGRGSQMNKGPQNGGRKGRLSKGDLCFGNTYCIEEEEVDA